MNISRYIDRIVDLPLQLYNATDSENTNRVSELLRQGVSPNVSVPGAEPLLYLATIHLDVPTIIVLLQYGADPNARYRGSTILRELMVNDTFRHGVALDVLQLLIDYGLDLDEQFTSIENGIPEDLMDGKVLALLIKNGLDPYRVISTLMRLDYQIAISVALHWGVSANISNMDGVTLLMLASEYGYTDVVKHLLRKGADPCMRDRCGRTARAYTSSIEVDDLLSQYRCSHANSITNRHSTYCDIDILHQ